MGHLLFRRCFIAIAISLSLFSAAVAQDETPMTAYAAYEAAMQAGDVDEALLHAGRAYELAQEQWEPGRMETGLLASNYAFLLVQKQDYREAIKLYEACADVLLQHLPEMLEDAANCQFQTGLIYQTMNRNSDAIKAYEKVLQTIGGAYEASPQIMDTAGRANLALAGLSIPRRVRLRNQNDDYSRRVSAAKDYAEQALYLLTQVRDPNHPELAAALFFIGQYYESKRDWANAQSTYSRAHAILRNAHGDEHELTTRVYGRAIYAGANARRLDYEGEGSGARNDYARRFVSKEDSCFVIMEGEEQVSSCSVRKIPPQYPNRAGNRGHFGFAEIRFDVNENGNPENITVFEQWPGEYFGDASVRAVRKWKYTPPVNENGEPRRITGIRQIMLFELGEG